MTLTCASIEKYLSYSAARGASVETLRAHRTDLMQLLNHLNPVPATWAELEDAAASYLTAFRSTWAPKTTIRRVGTFRKWAQWSGQDGFLVDYKVPTPAPPEAHPIPEGIDGVKRMLATTRNPRHRALIVLTGLCGLRVSEAIGIRPEHIDVADKMVTVRGKGDRTRVVPIGEFAWANLERAYELAVREGTSLTRLSQRGARHAVTRHARNAGLSRHVASHDMRATFATTVYDRTKDLRVTQELLGHADPRTTVVYTMVSADTKRRAVEL